MDIEKIMFICLCLIIFYKYIENKSNIIIEY